MTEYIATSPGLYPLPDQAKDRLSDLKGHQKEDLIGGDEGPEVTGVYDEVRAELVEHQVSAGLDRVVEGQARWDDMIAHPLAVHPNVETGGIVRYYDNNNFYRDPRVTGELTFSGDVAAELEAAADLLEGERALQAVLPGPHSLASLATDEHYGDAAELLAGVAGFLAGEVDVFPEHETLYLLEPSLVTRPPEDAERVADAVADTAAATDADVVVHTYWGALDDRVYTALLDSGLDAVGHDLVAGDAAAAAGLAGEYGATSSVGLGVIDGQNTLVESPAEAADAVQGFLESSGSDFDRVYVTPNTELFYLPVNRYREKLDAVAGAAEVLAG